MTSATDFVTRWTARAHGCDDCFDRFFSAWIALVIEARRHLDENQMAQPDTDRISVLYYFEARADAVTAVLDQMADQTKWLANRRGTDTGEAILDVHAWAPEHLRQDFEELAQVWSGQAKRKPRRIASLAAEMVNHIRNNMFHGLKLPDDSADRELLDRVNAILLGVLDAR
jgi:hypothetical protein